MPVQLELLDRDRGGNHRSISAQLPQTGREEIVELFATLLAATGRQRPTTEKEPHDPRED